MLKSFFGKSSGPAGGEEPVLGRSPPMKIDLAQIKTLIDFFPIGKKLRYYPEFKQDIVLDTLIVAYCVNGNFVYSSEAIDRDPEGFPTDFHSGDSAIRTHVSKLKLFQLLVPDTSNLEMKLDYDRRALIGRGRQFKQGNCISLISNAGGRGVSTIDTEVAKQVDLADGPYAHANMILLTPDFSTLSVSDQRKKTRTKLFAPVKMFSPQGKFSALCTIVDISEGELRMRVRERGTTMPLLQRGDAVIVETELAEAERHYLIKATVIRRSAETCVIHLDGQIRDGKLQKFAALDLLELKSGLLNSGK
jgi:hypothetical protein